MIMDERLEFADALAANTGGVASYLLGDVVDLKGPTTSPNTLVDIEGSDLYFVISVDTSMASATGSVKFHLVSDAQAALATDGSATYHISTPAKLAAALVAGMYVYVGKLPTGSYERYLGVLQETITAAFTAGKVNIFLTSDPALYRAYADNVS